MAETDTTTNQLIGAMFTNQQMQIETVKEQQRLDLGRLYDKLSDMDSRVENFQADLNSQKQVVESSRQEIAAAGKRIDDSLIYAGQSLDRFGLGITIVLAVVGFVGYFSFADKTKREAESVAKQWFENQALDLQVQINELQREVTSARSKITSHIDEFERFAEDAKAEIQRNGDVGTSVQQDEAFDLSPVVKQRADLLKDIPVSRYRYDDWNLLAYTSYTNKEFEEAALYWLSASKSIEANDVEVASALYNRSVAQGHLNQIEVAISTIDELVRLFGNASTFALKEYIAKALLNKGVYLGRGNNFVAATKAYEEVINLFGDETDVVLKVQVANALSYKGALLVQQGKIDMAMEAYEEIICRFSSELDLSLQVVVAKSFVNKGVLLERNNQVDEAVATYEEVVRKFDCMEQLELKITVAKALVCKGNLLKNGADFVEVIRRFGDTTEPELKEQVAYAYNGIGFENLCKGKLILTKGNLIEASIQFKKSLGDINKALTYLNSEQLNGFILGNRAYALALLDEIKLAEDAFLSALCAPVCGGEELYKATLNDFETHPVPQDEKIKRLVERQWKSWSSKQGSRSDNTVS